MKIETIFVNGMRATINAKSIKEAHARLEELGVPARNIHSIKVI